MFTNPIKLHVTDASSSLSEDAYLRPFIVCLFIKKLQYVAYPFIEFANWPACSRQAVIDSAILLNPYCAHLTPNSPNITKCICVEIAYNHRCILKLICTCSVRRNDYITHYSKRYQKSYITCHPKVIHFRVI